MINRMISIGAAAVIVAATPAIASVADSARAGVQATFDASVAGWNAGDLDRFMACYKNAPDTVYLSGGQIARGYQAIHDRYAVRFGGGSTAAMGQLRLDILDFRMVDARHAFVVGQFHLHRSAADGGDAVGLTSLLFERTPAGWLIVADHS